jgi:hypothetical protein
MPNRSGEGGGGEGGMGRGRRGEGLGGRGGGGQVGRGLIWVTGQQRGIPGGVGEEWVRGEDTDHRVGSI